MNDNKRINQIMTFEVEGIQKTINQYCTDDFIKSYTEKLINLKFPEDKESISFIVSRLLKWYSQYIQEILNDKYIINKSAHIKSYDLLKEIELRLDEKRKKDK